MKQHEMKQIFDKIYADKNFMTPDIERYECLSMNYIAEISSGSGMLGFDTLYGVTVLIKFNDMWNKQSFLNKMLKSEEEVKGYIEYISNSIRLVESLSIPQCLLLIAAVDEAISLEDIEGHLNDILNNDDFPHIDSYK